MDVVFIYTSTARLSSVPVVNGQIIAVQDGLGWYYDLNGTRFHVANMGPKFQLTIPANSWTGSAVPYTCNVTKSGVLAADDYEILGIEPTGTASTDAAMKRALGFITYGTTSANTFTFVACEVKPDVDIVVNMHQIL